MFQSSQEETFLVHIPTSKRRKVIPQPHSQMSGRLESLLDAADSHCHLDRCFAAPGAIGDTLSAIENSVTQPGSEYGPIRFFNLRAVISNFCDPKRWHLFENIINEDNRIYGTIGYHPKYLKNSFVMSSERMRMMQCLDNKYCLGFGEIGLDHYHGPDNQSIRLQVSNLYDLLDIYSKSGSNKALVLHFRGDADSGVYHKGLEIIKECGVQNKRIHVHCFSGSRNDVMEWCRACPSAVFGFTGIITKTTQYDSIIEYIPSNRIVAETDSPMLSPYNCKSPNHPFNVVQVLDKIAHIKKMKRSELYSKVLRNTNETYRIWREPRE